MTVLVVSPTVPVSQFNAALVADPGPEVESKGLQLSDSTDHCGLPRRCVAAALAPNELASRAMLGHEPGRVDPCTHLDPGKLGPTARGGDAYGDWVASYEFKLDRSREVFAGTTARSPGCHPP